MLKAIKKDSGSGIFSLQTNQGKFSFSYLVRPRPESDFKAGTYGTEFIIHDEDTIEAIKTYLSATIKDAVANDWKKMPKDPHLPFRAGDEDNELEAGGYVLKTTTKSQPKLFIRLEGEKSAHEVTEDEVDDIYAGMLGEIIFSFAPYNYNGKCGITAYLNAVCKTDDDTPLSARTEYRDEFSIGSDFDEEDEEGEEDIKALDVEEEEESEDIEVDLDSLMKSKPGDTTAKPASTKPASTKPASTKAASTKAASTKAASTKAASTKPKTEFNLDDLLRK